MYVPAKCLPGLNADAIIFMDIMNRGPKVEQSILKKCVNA